MLNTPTIHNPDRYMVDLRQILSQGRKRIGILIGAGGPMAIRVNDDNEIVEECGNPLVPDVAGLTAAVVAGAYRKRIGRSLKFSRRKLKKLGIPSTSRPYLRRLRRPRPGDRKVNRPMA